jgi:hypothetical protein
MSHHQKDPYRIQQKTKIDAYHMSVFAGFVRNSRYFDGDGILLDHSILVYGCPMGDGDTHAPIHLPITIVGGACGTLRKCGRYIRYKQDTPFMNAGLTLLDKLGVQVDKIGDSTGKLEEL